MILGRTGSKPLSTSPTLTRSGHVGLLQATALVLIAEDSQVRHPRIGSQVAKSVAAVEAAGMSDPSDERGAVRHRGLLVQLDSDHQRRIWHVIYQQQPKTAADKTSGQPSSAAHDIDGEIPAGAQPMARCGTSSSR